MSKLVPAAKKLAVGAVAVGALSLGTAGVAGATGVPSAPKVGAHFKCARAGKVLSRIERGQAQLKAGLPKLNAAETKAKARGRTKRADRLAKVIKRLESPQFSAKLTKATQRIEAQCHVTAPAPTTTTS